eukprot:360194-Chlamydomonas_euryale.AAC.16
MTALQSGLPARFACVACVACPRTLRHVAAPLRSMWRRPLGCFVLQAPHACNLAAERYPFQPRTTTTTNLRNCTPMPTDLLKAFGLSRNPFTDRTAEKTEFDPLSLYVASDLRGFKPSETTYIFFGRRGSGKTTIR